MAGVLADAGALAVAVGGGCQHALFFVLGHQHGDDVLPFFQVHAAHAPGLPADGPHIILVKAHRLAAIREQHHVVFAVGQRGADQVVAVVQIDGDDAALAWIAEFIQRRLFDGAQRRGHEDEVIGREGAERACQRQHHRHLLARLQREHVDDRPAARVA